MHSAIKVKSKNIKGTGRGSSNLDVNAPGASTRPNQHITAPGE